jgi:hypothetical protein
MISRNPPHWAETALRSSLTARDRETITGDLLEEFRESIPEQGLFRARLWYVWQMATLITFKRRWDLRSGAGWVWLTGGLASMAVIVALLVRSRFQPPDLPMWALVVPAILVTAALTAIRSPKDLLQLWRDARIWAGLLIVTVGVRVHSDLLMPFDVEEYFLAQARTGFSETQFPRRFVLGALIGFILIAAGFYGAWRAAAFRRGVLMAVTTALLVALPWFAIELTKSHGPAQILVMAAAIGSVLGATGAMLGKALRGALQTDS